MKFEKLTHFARGFVYAYNGIRAAIREERNFRFHLCAALYAFVAAYWAQLPAVETALIALCVAAVLALTLWRSGTVTQILEGTRDLKTWMPSTSQTQPDQLPMLGQPVQDDQRTPTQPEQLGEPVQDKEPVPTLSQKLTGTLDSLLFGKNESAAEPEAAVSNQKK